MSSNKTPKAANRTPRRFELREGTAGAHAALDEMVGSFDTLESYRRYLRGIAAFRLSIDMDVSEWRPALGDWQPNRIDDQLRADLADLGMAPPDPVAATVAPRNREELFGTLYVLEGSALGARILFRRAQELGLRSDYGARHLARQSTNESWPSFVALMESADRLDMDKTIAASVATFRAAQDAFESLADVDR